MNQNNQNNDNLSKESDLSLHSLDSIKDSSSDITIDQKSANSGYSTSSSSLVTSTSSVSVLEPIHVTDARNRSFMVGSVGSNDSLLGRKEMLRYFPNAKMRVLIVSWNMSSRTSSEDLNELLLPESIAFVPDLYAIGIQEAPSSDINTLVVQMQATIGFSHVLLHSCSLGVLHLSIFLRRDLIWFCTIPEEAMFNSRPTATNMVKTKGALAISFAFFGTSFLFINCHLSAHQNKINNRIEEYQRICHSINLPKNLLPLNSKYESKDVTERFDCVFWFGDLNFRLEIDGQQVKSIINRPNNLSKVSLSKLKDNDQLTRIMEKGLAFNGFHEPKSPGFPPTYKFKYGSDDYDLVSQRVPSFTDRILYRCKKESSISALLYDWAPQMDSSDHKPVFALFEVELKPGRDSVSRLNAGAFNRTVYIEAMKKRVNDMNVIRKNGSIVCSLM